MNIKITADSTCDLPPQLLERHGIELMPLTVHMDGRAYRDGVNIRPQDIYDHVEAGGALCATAAPNVEEYDTLFRQFCMRYDAVVHVSLGANFSSSHDNAWTAAQGFGNVRVIDSRNASTGQGLVVLAACELARDCADLGAMCAALEELTGRVETSFLLDRLDYMAKGGRCSAVMRLGANLLSLKPCIEIKDGSLRLAKKYRGSLERCLRAYIRERLGGRADIERRRLFLTHTPMPAGALAAARAALVEAGGSFEELHETSAGCTIGCHCGPGTLGVLFVRDRA